MASGVTLIARREFVERGRTRVFLGVLIGSMALILLGTLAASMLARPTPTLSVAVAGNYPGTLVADVHTAAIAHDVDLDVVELPSAQEARSAVASGTVGAALVDARTIVALGAPQPGVESVLRSAATESARRSVAESIGLSDAQVRSVLVPVQVEVIDVSPTAIASADIPRALAAFASVAILFILVMTFGQFVGSAVVEEKQSRVAELVLAKVSTASMLVGKVLGIGGLGLVQLVLLGMTYLFGAALFGAAGPGAGLAAVDAESALWLAIWFVVGYLMYSFVFATMGATVSRIEDLQSLTYVPTVMLLPAYVMAALSMVGIANPLLAPMSLLPWWAPLLMPFRMVTGVVPAWQVVIALLGSAAFIALLIWFGARVYRGAALRAGGRVRLREAYRAG